MPAPSPPPWYRHPSGLPEKKAPHYSINPQDWKESRTGAKLSEIKQPLGHPLMPTSPNAHRIHIL